MTSDFCTIVVLELSRSLSRRVDCTSDDYTLTCILMYWKP